jgi:LPS-assembly protein
MHAQVLTTQVPADPALPDAPTASIPVLVPVLSTINNSPVGITADQQRKVGDLYYLDGNAVITYHDYVLSADHITYNSDTDLATAEGHLRLIGGIDDEDFTASHGSVNLDSNTGTLYDVSGSIGLTRAARTFDPTAYDPFRNNLITDNFTGVEPSDVFPAATNPILITGRVVHKLAPYSYQIEDGSMTSCMLPRPNWRISGNQMSLNNNQGSTKNAWFHFFSVPLVYLPYATHPVDSDSRQSGLLVPVISESTTNGLTLGEEFYWAISRNADMLVGVDYLSKRGWAQKFALQYRGVDRNFINFRYNGLLDRGFYQLINNINTYTNQGGEDATLDARRDLGPHTYAASSMEYLSSYVYREAFSESFLQSISSEVDSGAFLTHEQNGTAASIYLGRFQSFENATIPSDIIRILHTPSVEFSAVEQPLGHTPLNWAIDATAASLQRHEPGFDTAGLVQRVDIHPRIYGNLHWDGFSLVPEIGIRNTFYSRSQLPTTSQAGGGTTLPVERDSSIDRKSFEASIEFRPPALERVYQLDNGPASSGFLHATGLNGAELKHTIEPFLKYNFVGGVEHYNNILRFDPVDILSDTSELHYGLTQRLFLHRLTLHQCKPGETPLPGETLCRDTAQEWLNWTISGKYFFDTDFGGALIDHRRNVIDSSLDFTGVAFLTGPRNLSPVQSQLRIRTTERSDFEWDLNYDTVNSRVAASNVYADYRQNNWFAGAGDAHLNAPDEVLIAGAVSHIADFNQIRLMLGYGAPDKRGFGAAANYGYDINQNVIEYSAIQSSYNSNCCGLSFEYRHYSLGSIRDENVYRFSITLNGIGTTGNLRRADRIY